jgi:hypothetical protein
LPNKSQEEKTKSEPEPALMLREPIFVPLRNHLCRGGVDVVGRSNVAGNLVKSCFVTRTFCWVER